jgi:hypothetical protein
MNKFCLRRLHRLSLLPLLALLFVAACGTTARPESDLDDDSKDWQEIQAELPGAPQAADLVAFYVSPTTQFHFSIDRKSISVGKDGVVRYTLVSVSNSGVKNISYEGIRCDTLEKKLYAFGRNDGTWAKSRNAQWEPVTELSGNRQHAALVKDLLCVDGLAPADTKPILARLK